MKHDKFSLTVALLLYSSLVGAQIKPTWLSGMEQSQGNVYRQMVSNIVTVAKTDNQVEKTLATFVDSGVQNSHVRILLARIRYPKIFDEFDKIIKESRGKGDLSRPGLLSGMLMRFTKQGAESKFVDQYEKDQKGQVLLSAHTNATKKASGMRATFKKVEKYTDDEVHAGIARNTAARHAILEHVLKFFTEGSAYEQCEIVDVVYSLWGSPSLRRRNDEPLADDLIEPIYKDKALPLVVRYTAMSCLSSNRLGDYEGFLIDAVKISMMEEKTRRHEDVLYRVLERLEKTADKNTLSVLKGITNGTPEKVKMVCDATQKIEMRLSKQEY